MEDTACICFPLAKDEVVTAAWIRERNIDLAIRELALVVRKCISWVATISCGNS